MRHQEKITNLYSLTLVLNCPAVLPFNTMVFAWGTVKINKTRVKSFTVKNHLQEVKKAQKGGRDTTQKKTNLIQEEYTISVSFHH